MVAERWYEVAVENVLAVIGGRTRLGRLGPREEGEATIAKEEKERMSESIAGQTVNVPLRRRPMELCD